MLGVPITNAVGTSLIVITVASIAALAIHVTAVHIPWAVTAVFTATAMLGALLAKGATSRRLTNLFAALAVAVAAFLLVANLPASL